MSNVFQNVRNAVFLTVALLMPAAIPTAAVSAECWNDICEEGENCSNCWQDCYGITCWCGDEICEECEEPNDGQCGDCYADCGECNSNSDCLPGDECCGEFGFPQTNVCCGPFEYCDYQEGVCKEIPQ